MRRVIAPLTVIACATVVTAFCVYTTTPRLAAAPVPKEFSYCHDCICRMWYGFVLVDADDGTTYSDFCIEEGNPPYQSLANAYPEAFCTASACDGDSVARIKYFDPDTQALELMSFSIRESNLGNKYCTTPSSCSSYTANRYFLEGAPTNPTSSGPVPANACRQSDDWGRDHPSQ